jgi:hypothetical protein
MRSGQLFIAAGVWLTLTGVVWGQFQHKDPGGVRLGDARVQQYRAGMTVDAVGGACKNIVAYLPCPIEWPEQDVKVVSEDISAEARITYETLAETVKLMVIKVPLLADKHSAKAIVTFEVRRSQILPPEDTDKFVLADVKTLPHSFQAYLRPSPKIESQDPKIRGLAKQIAGDSENQEKAWDKIEAIYNWVVDHVHYKAGSLRGALAALRDGTGECEDISSLFIAICRAENIPARTVWVPGHCYPEFYVLDEKGAGHWFPCEIEKKGLKGFGSTMDQRPILQKGDNFSPPWDRRGHERYLAEYLSGAPAGKGGQPRVRWLRDVVVP